MEYFSKLYLRVNFMFKNRLDLFLILSCMIEMMCCLYFLNQLTIFQFMFFAQILPSLLLALIMGRIANRVPNKVLILTISGVIYSCAMYVLMKHTPMVAIEANTVQSATSVFEFNREIHFVSYVGFFLQEFFLTAFVMIMTKVFNKIKLGIF